jgi:hypothetical protein
VRVRGCVCVCVRVECELRAALGGGEEEDRHKAGVRACKRLYQANKLLQAEDLQ